MQTSFRRLADVAVKGARFLEAGQPTGLTGLPTHPTPRSTLLYTYERTLEKLSRLPAHSVYRQATEALTRQRLETIASIRPAGWDEWAGRASEKVRQRPELFSPGASRHQLHKINGVDYVQTDAQRVDATGYDLDQEWDGEENAATLEGTRSSQESRVNLRNLNKKAQISESDVQWEPEPQLDVQQIDEAEKRIGAGLIEEVIQVAEGECQLVDTMIEAKIWDDLEEPAAPGQWEYFARDQHTPGTQEPPNKPS